MTRPHQPLQLRAQAETGLLSPEQKRFNKLTQQIDQARQKLQAWQDNIPPFVSAHRERTAPYEASLPELHRAWLFELDRLLDEKGWTKTERATLKDLLCDGAWHFLDGEAEPDLDIKALFDKHADESFDDAQADERQLLVDMIEGSTGLDLGDDALDCSEDELMTRMHQKLHAQQADSEARAQDQDQETQEAAGSKPARKPTKAQIRQQVEAEMSAQSLREIYRKLASALHPDREPDAQKREARTALMQRVNYAYDRKDLLALLQLQLETAQVCANDITATAPERLKLYNKALNEQLGEIKEELRRIEMGFRMEFEVPPDMGLHPDKLVKVLDAIVAHLCYSQHTFTQDMRTFKDRAATKRWIKAERERAKFEAMFADDLGYF